MKILKNHSKIALSYFLIAALFGLILRSFYFIDIPITYKYFVHTHSHIALLGWVYIALTTLIYKLYLEKHSLHSAYRYIFWFTQITLLGMLFSFPFKGYAVFSIIFSTLFLIASYWFFWFFRKNTLASYKNLNSYKCITAALWYMVISSIGPWALGAIMNTLGATSIWYKLAIYFYLHFQYNGWMILALIGILLYILEQRQIRMPAALFKKFFWSINIGIITSFFLSTLWATPTILLNFIGGLGGVLQLLSLAILILFLLKHKKELITIFSSFQLYLLKSFFVLLLIKMMLQLITALPYFANLTATILDFTIGYLHWTFLGVITIGLFLFLDYFKLIKISKNAYHLYLAGFITTEALIFYKGFVIWQRLSLVSNYLKIVAIASLFIVLGLLLIFIKNLYKTDETNG